ncbi:hypothetical protein WMY93_012705 [Mugilogobius chulae]|uniref:ribonuclease H n=1 Tax=Mugilogobius chulae TaxID=88201 RepID=A0AAW0P407_9GOBI
MRSKEHHVTGTECSYTAKTLGLYSIQAATALQLVARLDTATLDSTETVKKEFPELFSGLGTIKGEYNIVLKPGAQPFSVSTPRRISLPLLPKVKEELSRMEQQGVISKGEQPTEWCAPMVVVPKRKRDRVRICSDLTKLNKSVLRERHQLPSVENTLGQLAAPEHFQKRMQQILESLEGVVCQMDDILIWGADQKEHDERLRRALTRLRDAGVTLNDKCEFSKTKIKFLGQIIEATGVSPDPEKVSAVRAMKEPSNISEVRRFLGMTNHLGKFLPHLAEKTRPLRELLRKTNMWSWGPQQMQAFESIKQDLTTPPGLALYDPSAETLVSADSSSYGLGAVLLQKTSTSNWKPIAYASRALSTTEQRYAQIEKEALATTWACERFAEFLIGNDFHIHTDHKPLVPLLGSRNLDELPPRIQRLKMRLMRFSFTISHVPGKEIATADVLSRAPIAHTEEGLHEEEIDLYADAVVASIPATEKRLKEVQKHQDKDEILLQLKQFCLNGWPNKFEIEKGLQPYLPFAANGYSPTELLMGRKIRTTVPVIPSQLDPHGADLGKVKSREQSYRQRQKQNYYKRHRAHDMPSLQQGEHVWIKDMQQRGTVVSTAGTPRSYIVETPNGNLRRNRYHLSRTPVAPRLHITFPDTTSENNPVETEPVSPEPGTYHSFPENVEPSSRGQIRDLGLGYVLRQVGFGPVTLAHRLRQGNSLSPVQSEARRDNEPLRAFMVVWTGEHGNNPHSPWYEVEFCVRYLAPQLQLELT